MTKEEHELFRMFFLSGLIEAFKKCGHKRAISRFCRSNQDIVESIFQESLEKCWEVRPRERFHAIEQISNERFTKFIEVIEYLFSASDKV
jgi:hypothetical protein